METFNGARSPRTTGEPEPTAEKFPGRAPLACATLDGVIHLAHGTPRSDHVVTETMSISGLLTPKLPVSYASSDQKTTNNGYGTLAEAGWTDQRQIEGTKLGSQVALAMCCDGQRLWLALCASDDETGTDREFKLEGLGTDMSWLCPPVVTRRQFPASTPNRRKS